jgi:hypothetical protein
MKESLAVIQRAHPAVLPLLLVVRHLRVPHLAQIRIAAVKICLRVVVQVIVAVQLEM